MELEIEPTPAGVRLIGEMTIYSAATLKPALLERSPTGTAPVEVDLTQVSEFDSAGLQLLLMLKRPGNLRAVRITAASQVVTAALKLCRLEHLIEPEPVVEVSL